MVRLAVPSKRVLYSRRLQEVALPSRGVPSMERKRLPQTGHSRMSPSLSSRMTTAASWSLGQVRSKALNSFDEGWVRMIPLLPPST